MSRSLQRTSIYQQESLVRCPTGSPLSLSLSLSPPVVPLLVLVLAISPFFGFGGSVCCWNWQINGRAVETSESPALPLGSQEAPVRLRSPSQQLCPTSVHTASDQRITWWALCCPLAPYCVVLLQECCLMLNVSGFGDGSCSSGLLTNQFPCVGEQSRQIIH